MVKAVFFDIDGTLTNSQGRVISSTKEALRKLNEKKILACVATGRGPDNLNKQLNGIKLDGYVLYNGQYVILKNNVIYENPFSVETLYKLARFGEKNRMQLLFGTDTTLIGSRFMRLGHNRWVKQLSRIFRKYPSGVIGKIAVQRTTRHKKFSYTDLPLDTRKVYQIVMMLSEEEEEQVSSQFPECAFTRSNPLTVDIVPKGASKIVGIEHLLQACSIKMKDAMAFGDSWNDLEMLREVGTSVAMGNANDDVKKVADYVTDTNDNDGISNALNQLNVL